MKHRYQTFALLLVTVFLSAFSMKAMAQRPIPFEMKWRNGVVILNNGDTIQGQTSISFPNDVVRVLKTDGTVETIMPAEVQMLEVVEPFGKTGDILKSRRVYKQFNWNRDNDYSAFKAPALFIVVESGKYGLLAREEKQAQERIGGNLIYMAGAHITEQAIIEKFYIRTPDQQVKLLRDQKDDFVELFPERKKLILNYARNNNLSFKKVDDLAKIVAYCNSL
ncbi:hypothetical protein I5M27_04685 [Adhaeribacter sp. BT258]|uniref:DUF4369 domain-containing protein n=1 Tax=Adhaeribacter terrigena TaxID=2793070 RepID=A0ABS1BYM1_9BACT|nr:hypothetical protein [Adhaeribacter terrigena]MBK0402268.1 hypothetical protein [Adhaeribacter terrigena]